MKSPINRWEDVIRQLREVFKQKNTMYGESAFYEGEIPEFKYWMRLSDIRRKSTRLDKLTDLAARGDQEARRKLISDYKDLANYAIIAVAVLEPDAHISGAVK